MRERLGHLEQAFVRLGAAPLCKKHPHDTPALAEAAIRSLKRRGRHQPEKGDLVWFECSRCGKYHTAHRR